MNKKTKFVIPIFALGICSIVSPNLLQYINFNYIDLALIIREYPHLKMYIGLVVIAIGFFLLLLNPRKVYCIKSNDIVDALPKLPIMFSCEKELTLTTTNISKETLRNAITDVNNFARDINTSKIHNPYFFSICDIPFIVKTGYLIGDGTHPAKYLHYIRSKGKYIEIKGNTGDLEILSDYVDKGSDKLLVTLSTSFKINTTTLNDKFSDMNLLNIETKIIGVDCIIKRNDLDYFCDFAINTIREKSTSAINVHLLLATSSSVAFAIGQRLSNTMDRPTIVYQFDNSNIIDNRPWGIVINSNNQEYDDIILA